MKCLFQAKSAIDKKNVYKVIIGYKEHSVEIANIVNVNTHII